MRPKDECIKNMKPKISLKELIASKEPRVGNTLFIAVDGHGGSGKSSLAQHLAKMLGAEIIHTDDFASWDNPKEWWPLLIDKVFKPIAGGATSLSYERSKWWENHHPKPAINEPVTPIMILEGVSSLRKEFKDFISLGVFVDTPIEACLKRGIERDSATGKSKEEITELWNGWLAAESQYFAEENPKAHADLVFDGTVPFAEQIVE